MGKVIFFPMKHQPDAETKKRLAFYQEHYSLYHAELVHQIRENKLSRGQEWIFRENSHNRVRETWKLYQGFKEEIKDES